MQQGIVISCWAPYGRVDVQSASEKAHDVKKAGEGKKKAAPKKVSAASLQCPAACTGGPVRHLLCRRSGVCLPRGAVHRHADCCTHNDLLL